MKQRDAESLAHSSQQPSVKRKREKRPPLWWRITFEEHMVALVRLLGHEGLALKDLREKAKPLIEKFGRERLQEAADEITEYVGDGDDTVVRLTEQVRKLAVHLIGPPPLVAVTQATRSAAPSSTPLQVLDTESDVTSNPMESSESPGRGPVENGDRDWVNYETQCVYRFLIQDQDFLDECRHLAAICRKRAASADEVESDAPEESKRETSRLAEELERFVREFNPLADDTTPFNELLDAALGNVDWYALAESVFERDGGDRDPQ